MSSKMDRFSGLMIALSLLSSPASYGEPFVLESPAFHESDDLPVAFTCMGDGSLPPLQWKNPPKGTETYVLVIQDLDAPFGQGDARNTPFFYWGIYNLPGGIEHLPEAAEDHLPAGVSSTFTDADTEDFRAPCTPSGPHRYRLTLYAIDRVFPPKTFTTTHELDERLNSSITAHREGVVGKATLTAILRE